MLRAVEPRVRQFVLLVVVLLASSPAFAQQQPGGIAGIVRDTTGAVLPGVTVEAASPALIEKVRSVATDGEGRYTIVNLPPGTYVVTFTLGGFSTLRREGIQITTGFTATVNGDLRVGTLEETVTVSGAAPLVDTQNVVQQNVVSAQLLAALPTGTKSIESLLVVTPGVSGNAAGVGGAQGTYRSTSFNGSYHGKRDGGKANFDGLNVTNTNAGSGAAGYIINGAMVEEMLLEGGGASAESNVSAFSVNFVPKQGGNEIRGTISGVFADDNLQSNNLTDSLRARGLTTTSKVVRQYDFVPTVGGPIKQDRLWFYYGSRWTGLRNQWAGSYWNATQGTRFYTPDLERPAAREDDMWSHGVRLTWQINEKQKLNIFADTQHNVTKGSVNSIVTAPEAVVIWDFTPQGLYQATWTYPLTSRLLVEGGASFAVSAWPQSPLGGAKLTDISLLEQSTSFRWNAANIYVNPNAAHKFSQRAVVSYVTGSHAVKAGMQLEQGFNSGGSIIDHKIGFNGERIEGNVSYDLLNGAPNRVWQFATPYEEFNRIKADLGLFAQDQYTVKRLTLNLGVRFDWLNGFVPAQTAPASAFLPERSYDRVVDVPNWKDINPRLGVTYDLFGNGRTAVKASLGRYLNKAGVAVTRANNPFIASVQSVNRVWTDGNGDFFPDCVLQNPLANGECGQISDLLFGQLRINNTYDPDLLEGWGKRQYLWDFSAEVQHELFRGISMTAGYYRNWYGNFIVTDNRRILPSDHTSYCVKAPTDARLPRGGGYEICDLADVSLARFGQVDNFITRSKNFGDQTQVSDFVSFTVQRRPQNGVMLGGGIDTGRTVEDRCFVVDSPQELLNCRIERPSGAQTQLKVYGSYDLPAGFVVSGVFRNEASLRAPAGGQTTSIEAVWAAPNAVVSPALGRNLAACGTRVPCTATTSIPLITPYEQFEGRLNQLDLRLTKSVSMGRSKLQANLDLYNALNRSPIVGVVTQFGSRWLTPTQILDGRLIQFSANLTF
ncbi:MAG: TonB-dependent receptor [Vicinamibacterales bacterium]